MPKKAQDYLLAFFIIAFLIMTVVVSLYASGYKFNLSWPLNFNRLLQKTGMLVINTEPARAIIYLNDKPEKDSSLKPWKKDYLMTPAKIKNLLPGEYSLRLKADGYWPYEQKIWINSGETTFVEDVNLFLENTPLLITPTPKSNLNLSPDKKYLYIPEAKKIVNLKTGSIRNLNLTDNTSGAWQKNNKLLAAGIIFDPLKEAGDINYANLIGASTTNLQLDVDSGRLYYQNRNAINYFETNNKKNSLLISGKDYLDYKISQEKILTIVNENKQIQLESYSLKNYKLEATWVLPNSGNYNFVEDISSYLAVYDDRNKTLYLFTASDIKTEPIIIRDIKNWAAMDDQSLIYTNGFEIYIFNFNSNRSDLATRRGEEISDIIWNATGNYLIFSSPNTLNVLDFKNRNTTLLFKAEAISSPAFDDKNDTLYFWANSGQQEGVYKILMQ